MTCCVSDLHVILDKSTKGCHEQVANKLLGLFVQLSLHQPAQPPANKGDVPPWKADYYEDIWHGSHQKVYLHNSVWVRDLVLMFLSFVLRGY